MFLTLLACHSLVPSKPAPPAPDLTERLGADQVRAGTVTDVAALFNGISAEGAVGDVKIYNDRVAFVIEAPGDSSFYGDYGGGLIDADLVRPEGQPGRDLIDDMWVMAGVGRVLQAETVEVISDGSDGAAHVRVSGWGEPLLLLTGALESPDLIADLDLWMVTDYVLRPGAWSVEITTTVENRGTDEQLLAVGDAIYRSLESCSAWWPHAGFDADLAEDGDLVGLIGDHNELALTLTDDDGGFTQGSTGTLLSALGDIVSGFQPTTTLPAGGTVTWTRHLGVAPDLATLAGEQLVRRGAATSTLTGTVTADGAGVAGARVHVLDAQDRPISLAITDSAGAWTATVEATADNASPRFVATGRSPGYRYDLPDGYAPMSPYAPRPEEVLTSLSAGAPPVAFAEGYGVSAPTSEPTLSLVPPGRLAVTVDDGGPALARLCFLAGDPVPEDERLYPGRPSGCSALLYLVDGQAEIVVEPGEYTLMVHRGVRHEVDTQDVVVVSGELTSVSTSVPLAWDLPGLIIGDPHNHASPSGDGSVPMAERLLTVAANGIDVHFGTDHDHVADYRPLLAPIGLDGVLTSVVADEVSPVLRGHFNAWPATLDPTAANGGAPRWWQGYVDTEEIFGWMRDLVGDGVISANHPVGSSGMFSFADYDWEEGEIGSPDAWSADFDAMEVLNSGDWAENLPPYLDLVRRGHPVTALGVSDSHGPTSGHIGLSHTFFLVDEADVSSPEAVTAALVDAVRRRATAVSFGPYVDVRVNGNLAAGTTIAAGSNLDVVVYAPSWIPVETVTLWQDGEVVSSAPCVGAAPTPCEANFPLNPENDASYVVIASSSSTPMTGPHAGQLAWGLAGAVFVDTAGDGWTPPRAPLF